jgi:hypothetical protein
MSAQPEEPVTPVEEDTTAEVVVDLARPDAQLVRAVSAPGMDELEQLMVIAERLSEASIVPAALRGKRADILVVLLTSREIGIGPMQALQGIHVIDGKAAMSAELMRALVQRAGHSVSVSGDHLAATAVGRRTDTGTDASYTFTMEDAEIAGLTLPRGGKPSMYLKYPKNMLAARATANLCRLLFADVIAGVAYLPEELEQVQAERVDHPRGRAAEIPVSEDLAAVLTEIGECAELDPLRDLWRTAMSAKGEDHKPLFSLREKARIKEAAEARAAVLEQLAAGQKPAVVGEDIVDAELVDTATGEIHDPADVWTKPDPEPPAEGDAGNVPPPAGPAPKAPRARKATS